MPPRKSAAATARSPALARSTTVIASAPPTRPDVPSTDAHLGLLIEHLTFNPRAFIDALVYVANEALYRIGEELEPRAAKLITEHGNLDADGAAREAEKGTHSMMTLLENALDHVFDTLELYSLQSVFGVTERQAHHMVLPHHAGLDLRQPRSQDGVGSTGAAQESTELSERQRDLNRKINAARSTSYALTLAVQASERRRVRMDTVHARLLSMLGEGQLGERAARLLEAVDIMKSHREPLIAGIEKLRSIDPLGKALTHPTSVLQGGGPADPGPSSADDADAPWSSGREGYLRWQTQRLLSSSRQAQNDEAGNETVAALSQPANKKRKSILDVRGDRRRSGRPSIAMHSSDGGLDGVEVGAANEMEKLANLLQHRPSSQAPSRK
ncbi:unnamed protein product [Parajaminaea phylloscopi]